jgi:hypothetical protein
MRAVADDSLHPQDKFKLGAKFKPGTSLQFCSASYDNYYRLTFIPTFRKFHGSGKESPPWNYHHLCICCSDSSRRRTAVDPRRRLYDVRNYLAFISQGSEADR